MDMVKTLLESDSVEVALKKFKEEYLQAERSIGLKESQ
jgi:ribosomal protein S21